MLIGVDLVLGPLLTLIVFKPGKRLLIVDVAFIVTLQICALVYGLTVLYNERPYYVVFAIDRIHVFAEKDVAADARAAQPWIVKPAIGPVLASARRPDDIEAQQRLLEETVFGNAPDIERRPSFWVPLAEDLQALRDNALPLDLLRDAGAKEAAVVDETLAAHAGRDSELGIYPIIAANNDATAIVDLTTGELLRVVAAEPWSIVARQHE